MGIGDIDIAKGEKLKPSKCQPEAKVQSLCAGDVSRQPPGTLPIIPERSRRAAWGNRHWCVRACTSTDYYDKIWSGPFVQQRTNMSDSPADEQQGPSRKPFNLPPMFGPIENGERTWKRVGEIDYELMGYLLSCHLLVEHYMDEYLKAHFGYLDWDAAKLTFGQRVGLLGGWKLDDRFNPVSTIKHLNSLRNRFSHRVDYVLSQEDLLPIVQYLERAFERPMKDIAAKELLELFTTVCCAAFAGSVTGADIIKARIRKNGPQKLQDAPSAD